MSDPTAALLWAACRPVAAIDDMRAAIADGADLNVAAEVALAQRVSPLLWRALNDAGVNGAGEPWAAALQQDASRCRAQSRLTLPRIGELALGPLADAGLPALVIKGGALVGRYPDAALRPMDDVDLILPVDQIDPGIATLAKAGWVRRPSPPRRPHEIDLTHPALPGLPIDLHKSLAWWRTRANQLTIEDLWSARQPTTVFGAAAFGLPAETELVMLAAHAAKPFHVFSRLVWTVDLAMVVADAETKGGLDWPRVRDLTASTRCPTAVAVALTQAARLGVDSPADLRQLPGPAHRTAELDLVLAHDWPVTPRDSGVRMSLRYRLVDERRAMVTLVVSDILGKEGPATSVRRAGVLAGRAARLGWRRLRGRVGRSDRPGEETRDLIQP